MSWKQTNDTGLMLKRQAKIVNSTDTNCPRLNNNNSVVVRRRTRRFVGWGSGTITRIPRISININTTCPNKTKKKPKHKKLPRLPGFFQAQLRMMKSFKQQKEGKLCSNKPVDSEIISSSTNSLVSKKSKKLMQLQTFNSSGSSDPVLKRHRNITDNKLRNNGSRIHDLPKELLAEILVRLPVKYILRCRSVQKSWNCFIISPVFISLQLNYQKQIVTGNYNHHYPKYLLFQEDDSLDLRVRIDDLQCEEYCKLEFLPGLPHDDNDDDIAWFALSYGLICMSTIPLTGCNRNRNIYLWNPLVKKYKTLPDSPLPSTKNYHAWEALAFGFLPEVDDYVVIHIIKPCLPLRPHSVIIGVYSLKTNSWKKLSRDNVFISTIISDPYNVVFINGVAFWVGLNLDKQRTLLCFDIKTDILCDISLPDWVASPSFVPIIYQFGQFVAYFVSEKGLNHFDMWVLKFDDINEFTWEKKMCITSSKDVEEEVLGVRNNGDPILAKSNNFISYSLDSHQENNFVDSWDRWTPNSSYQVGNGPPYVIRTFVESLVLLSD